MEKTTSAASQRKMIRANPAQTAILKSALEATPTPTPVQIQVLSSETNLPTKWIHSWFGRQRVKTNPARARASGRRRVKEEALDAGEALARASSPSSAGASMSASASTSDCFSITASSSGATLTAEGASRPKPGRSGKQEQKDEQQEPADSTTMEKSGEPKRVLRSRGNRATKTIPPPPPAPTRRVKAEQIEAAVVESLRYTPPLAPIINASTSAPPPPIIPPALPHRSAALLPPRVGPPQRSPMGVPLPPIAGATKTRGPRSGLGQGVHTTYARVAPVATGKVARPAAAAARRRAPAPTFQNQFQHRGPADFLLEGTHGQYAGGGGGSASGNGGNGGAHTPTAVEGFVPPRRVVNSHVQAQKQNGKGGEGSVMAYGGARPLAPAFDWETHAPAQEALRWPISYASDINTGAPVAQEHGWNVYSALWDATNLAMLDTVPAAVEMYEQVPAGYVPSQATPLTAHAPIHMETPPVLHPPLVPMWLAPSLQPFTPFHAQAQAEDPVLSKCDGDTADALDPTRAPLKHLTEVLSAFRDERGGYARVLEPEQHGNLLRCLLDEALMPFEAAMGLAFLGRLGFQWDF